MWRQGSVDESDDQADQYPLDEVSHGLSNRKPQANVQIDVIVYDEASDREYADENSEVCAFEGSGTTSIEYGVNDGDRQDGDEHGDQAGRSYTFH
jgi:hypothetical protein